MSSKLKNLVLLIVIVIIAMLGYKYFFKKDAPQTALVSSSSQAGTATGAQSDLGKEFLALLLNLKVLSLDDSILESEPYMRLIDFTKMLERDPNPGRPNPFAPIGTEGALPVTATPTTPQPTLSPVSNGAQQVTPSPTTATVETMSATSVQSVSAVLNGTLPQSVSGTSVWFEYGKSALNLTVSTASVSQNLSGSFGITVSGLSSSTTYYYRVVARVSGKTIYGTTLSFRTK